MSNEPSPYRAPAANPLDNTRPAVFHRARIVEIKRKPSSHPSTSPVEQQPVMDSPHFRSSPPVRVDAPGTASMGSSPRRARKYVPSSTSPTRDVPPPPPPHSPSQRSIAQGSYLEYISNAPSSRPAHFSQPHPHATPPSRRHQRREEYLPSAAARDSPGSLAEATPHQSAPPPIPPRASRREEYDPRRLFPTTVRPPQSFQFELEEEPFQYSSSQPSIPGRFPSSPDTMRSSESPGDTQMGGVQDHEHVPRLRPQAGSYHALKPWELGMAYSDPALYQTAPSFDDSNPAEPFVFEIRSPGKGDQNGSNKPATTSQRAAYSARNPAHEAESYPLLRRLGADERYATSFGTQRGDVTPERDVAEEHGGEEMVMVDVDARISGNVDVRVTEIERRRAAMRAKR